MEENPGGAAARCFGRRQGEKLCVSEVTQVAVVKGGNRNLRWLWQVGDGTAKCIGNGIIITDNSGAGRDEFLHRFLYAIVRIIGKIPAYQGIFRKCTGVPQGMQHTLAAQKSGTHNERVDNVMTLKRFRINPGERCIIAEDVVTTGVSSLETKRVIEENGGICVGIACVVDHTRAEAPSPIPIVASALKLDLPNYAPEECPICKEGKLPLVHLGSRKMKEAAKQTL